MSSTKDIENAIRRANCEAPEAVRERLWKEVAEDRPSALAGGPRDTQPARSRTGLRRPAVRIALAALIGAGVVTAAVGVRHKYHFLRTEANGYQVVERDDGQRTWVLPRHMAADPQQAVETAEELDLLKQEGRAELVGVSEIEVNGRLDSRMLRHRYDLSDDRTFTIFERDPNDHAPMTLVGERRTEASRLVQRAMQQAVVDAERKAGVGVGHFVATEKGIFELPNEDNKDVELPTTQRVVLGRTFAFEKYMFTLADGTTVTWSIGRLPQDRIRIPKVRDTPTPWGPIPDDLREWASLRKQGKGQLIGVDDLTVNGQFGRRLFVYRYQLSDGQTLEMPEGAGALKPILSTAQKEEWIQAKKVVSGQNLGTYEEQVLGHTFAFTRQRFVLSDGTEILWSYGKPKDNP